jgi:hypothetical protein
MILFEKYKPRLQITLRMEVEYMYVNIMWNLKIIKRTNIHRT